MSGPRTCYRCGMSDGRVREMLGGADRHQLWGECLAALLERIALYERLLADLGEEAAVADLGHEPRT